MVPRWLAPAVALAVLVCSLALYCALETKQNQEIAQTVRAGAEGAKNQIEMRIEARMRTIERMARRWEYSGAPTQAAWEADAANYVHDYSDVQALEWLDATRRVRWIVPLAGNESKINVNFTLEANRNAAVELAAREKKPVITRIVTLFHGGLGFVVYAPIFVNGRADGFLAAVYHAQSCLDRFLPATVAEGEAITVSEGDHVFYQRNVDGSPVREDWIVQEKMKLEGATWTLRMWPTPALAARMDSALPEVVLCAGVLGALLLGAVCYLAQRSHSQATALQAALDKVNTLEGLLPVCMGCKRVRDDTGYWSQIDTYLNEHTNASISHGYCPECAAKAFQEYGYDVPSEVEEALAAGRFE
jgi:hypothetical protein